MKKNPAAPIKVGLISLGCAKNLVDAEIMLGNLLKAGVEITNDPAAADAVIVNTCSFIDAAQEESVDTILESAEVREASNRGQGLIVSGCLPQRFRDELPKLLPEVDAFMGIDQVAQVGAIVTEALERRRKKLSHRVVNPNEKQTLAKQEHEGHHSDHGPFSFPSPRPSPSGRGGMVSQVLQKSGPTGISDAGDGPSLSLRERAGVRGKRARVAKQSGGGALLATTKTILQPVAPLVEVNQRPNYIPDFATPRFRLTPRHTAYVKIAEGCNHPCAFCIIPRMRGSHRSRLQTDILSEAKALLADGVKELNLISQDSTYYGLDLRPNHSRAISSPERFNHAFKSLGDSSTTICSLLRELNQLPGNFWIRLLYTHPAHWTDDLIQTIAQCRKVARYVDIPLQHIHQNMLERMRRETSQQYLVDLLNRIRNGIPGIALRTTFIVGFPGETEEYFQTLLGFIRETKFERLGVFTYSQEEGTRAGKMAGQLSEKVKQQRRDRAMAVQHEVAARFAESFVGRTMNVLVEREASIEDLKAARVSSWEHGLIREANRANGVQSLKGRYLLARGEADAPDIDGRVYVRGKLALGEFATVRIIGHTDYDLIAEPA